jgi:hypothetical protein
VGLDKIISSSIVLAEFLRTRIRAFADVVGLVRGYWVGVIGIMGALFCIGFLWTHINAVCDF